MGWSPQINPWSKPLGRNADAALARDASTYTGLTQQQFIRDFGEMRVPPKAYDGVSDSVREEYG